MIATTTITDNSATMSGNITTDGNVTAAYFSGDGSLLTNIVSYISKWATGNFNGSLYTTGADSTLSDSNSLFQIISDTRGTPQFQIQDGGANQASFIARSFMIVKQNNTLLNMSQNNICSDWGFNHIDCNTGTTGADFGVDDDIEAQNLIWSGGGFRAAVERQSAFFIATDNITAKYSGATGSYDPSTYYFCDYTDSNFEDTGGWINIIDEGGLFEGATADINQYVNSSCITLKNNPGWQSTMTEVTWEVVNSPDLAIVKGGFFEYYVGDNKQSSFNIKVKNGTGSTGVHIDDTAGAGQHKSLTIDTDSTNKDGVIGLNIFMSSSTGVDSIASQAISLEGDATGFNNSILTFIDMNLIGAGNNNEVDAIHVNPLVSQIIEMGSADTLSSSYYEDLNITANVTNVGADAEVFADDNEYIYIGDSLNFTTISFALSTFSSKDIEPEYFYCDSAGTWQTLTGVVDTTDGFRISGSISFTNPTDRGVCNKEYDDTAFSDTANYTYIAIKRTESKDIVVSPVIDRIDISGSTDYFILQKDMIKLQGISSPPETCSASFAGAIYYDSNVNYHCSCNAVNWVRMSDPTDTTGCS